MVPFHGKTSTTSSRLQSHYEDTVYFGSFFMDEVHLSQSCRSTTRRQFTLTTKFPGVSGTHLIDLGRNKG